LGGDPARRIAGAAAAQEPRPGRRLHAGRNAGAVRKPGHCRGTPPFGRAIRALCLSRRLRPRRHRPRHLALFRRHHDHGGALAGRAHARLQRRPLGGAHERLSILRAAGLDSWCLADRGAFVERAIALARSPTTPAELAELRATLRDRLARSPACDSAGLCRALERIYESIAP
jgi:hypothetical protein